MTEPPPSKLTMVTQDEMRDKIREMMANLEDVSQVILLTVDRDSRVKVALIQTAPMEAANIMLQTADAIMAKIQ